jgi:hypothetical protein
MEDKDERNYIRIFANYNLCFPTVYNGPSEVKSEEDYYTLQNLWDVYSGSEGMYVTDHVVVSLKLRKNISKEELINTFKDTDGEVEIAEYNFKDELISKHKCKLLRAISNSITFEKYNKTKLN